PETAGPREIARLRTPSLQSTAPGFLRLRKACDLRNSYQLPSADEVLANNKPPRAAAYAYAHGYDRDADRFMQCAQDW
ncbi:MAG: hypothetical protein KAY24_11625, partial [Candidatus Eisenbacteria sp.]|nr:hypothetical protein [Candidatus Eisenbacteria bacterium]